MSEEDVFKSPGLPSHGHHTGSPAASEAPHMEFTVDTNQVDLEVPAESIEEEVEITDPKKSKISIEAPELDYKPPPWACKPDEGSNYQLEILKEGKIISHFKMDQRRHSSFLVLGRLPTCDIVLEHPSISRYHCVLQYGEDTMSKTGKGWFAYEMGSTHGSKVNKRRLPSKQFLRIYVGHVLQFGGSTRLFNLLGPNTDCEPEWDCSPTEMKLKVHKKALEAKLTAAAKKEIADEKKREVEEEGCNWGMDYGEDEKSTATPVEMDQHLMEDREAYYIQDPKKALTKFFEREGFDMDFTFTEQGMGNTHKWVCTIELPVEIDGVDRAFTASATVSTSKKDAQAQCALEACKILDSYGVLRRSNTKLRMKRSTLEANDFYEEDDDLYLDRTGQLEKQREKRKQWAEDGNRPKKSEKDTYESLCIKLDRAREEIRDYSAQLDAYNKKSSEVVRAGGDTLDDYVRQLEKGIIGGDDLKTKTEKSFLRQKLVAATHEAQKLEQLVKIAKPVKIPAMSLLSASSANKQTYLRRMMEMRRMRNDGPPTKVASDIPPSAMIGQLIPDQSFAAGIHNDTPSQPSTSGAESFEDNPVTHPEVITVKEDITPTINEVTTAVAGSDDTMSAPVVDVPSTLKRSFNEPEKAEGGTNKRSAVDL